MSRYFRLMGLSSGEILFSLPCGIYITYLNLQNPQLPWVSWEHTHYGFNVITLVPMMFLKFDATGYRVFMLNQWALPAGGFLFFMWFGFAGEAVEEYKRLFFKLVAPFGIKPRPASQAVRSQPTWYVLFPASSFKYLSI
jgi:pheromone a factor receptor